MKGNKTNHPKKYVRWSDWEAWLLKEWLPFKNNDFTHLTRKVRWQDIKLNFLLGFLGLVLALLAVLIIMVA